MKLILLLLMSTCITGVVVSKYYRDKGYEEGRAEVYKVYADYDDLTGGNDDWTGNNAITEITPEYVRQRLSTGLTLSALARELNLSRRTIGRLRDKF